jgi:hypothetical protein
MMMTKRSPEAPRFAEDAEDDTLPALLGGALDTSFDKARAAGFETLEGTILVDGLADGFREPGTGFAERACGCEEGRFMGAIVPPSNTRSGPDSKGFISRKRVTGVAA